MQLRLGRPKEALAAYERALVLEPDDLKRLQAARRPCWRPAAAPRPRSPGIGRRAAQDDAAATQHAGRVAHAAVAAPKALAIAGEQALDSGQTQAAIDAWLAGGTRARRADRHFDAALDAAPRHWRSITAPSVSHLELTRIYFGARLGERGG